MQVTGLEFRGEFLVLHYKNADDKVISSRTIEVNWQQSEPLQRVVSAFLKIVAAHLVEQSTALEYIPEADLVTLFQQLLVADATPPPQEQE